MNNFFKSCLAIAVFLLQGCSTIISGTSQPINMKVIDTKNQNTLPGVNCIVTDGGGGTYVLEHNPGQVVVHKSMGLVTVNCQKAGYTQLNTAVGDSFNPATLLNVLFWPGLFVDLATGAYKKYPSHYVVSMKRG